jgi:phosphoribosylaminoimidazolecarboxamide formyltransferase/IMP cyclohydrolase
LRNIDGGILVQNVDVKILTKKDLNVVTKIQPSNQNFQDALFTWKVLKHVKSNGILISKNNTTVGLGAGQVSRVDAVYMALKKGGGNLRGAVLASDAFFPFRDSIDALKDSGISTVIQPGGSIRDDEVVQACNEGGVSMIFTGTRCFKH